MSDMRIPARLALTAGLLVLATACERPPVESVQQGYRGTGMVAVANPRTTAELERRNRAPEALPPASGGPLAREVYANIQVLTDLDIAQFTRLMTAMTNWVSPKEGCDYCHVSGDLASDDIYTKVVSRRMIEMTRHINADWEAHVGQTGVTCYTCHRGEVVPAEVWYLPAPKVESRFAGNRMGQNRPAAAVGLTALPNDPLSVFLLGDGNVRVVPEAALATPGGASILATEQTYGFMFHISDALGVNCTQCHNTRSFAAWDQSNPQRTKAWHAIRLVRDLNGAYLEPLTGVFPPARLGPAGDVPKVSCATCHQGVSKPLLGARMLAAHPELARHAPPVPPAEEAPPAESAVAPTVSVPTGLPAAPEA